MLKVCSLSRSFGSKKVLDGVNFELPSSGITGLIGPGGGGKSVLLKIIGHVLKADAGEVVNRCSKDTEIGLMFQEGALFDSLSVFDNVAFPLVGGRVPTYTLPKILRDEVRDKVEQILARVGLSKATRKFPAQLSGGMRRRVSLARALVSKPHLVMLDDPTCGLDPVASSVIMNLILELHEEYRPTTILVSHDLRRLLPVVDKVLALFDGRMRFNGTLEELKRVDCPKVKTFVSCRYDLNGDAVH